MYLHLSIHKPHEHAIDDVADSLQRFGDALEGQAGLVGYHAFQTADGELIGITLWDSQQAFERGRLAGAHAIKDDPFHEWEAAPVVAFRGESIS